MVAWALEFVHWLLSFAGLLWFLFLSFPAGVVTRWILRIWSEIEGASRDV